MSIRIDNLQSPGQWRPTYGMVLRKSYGRRAGTQSSVFSNSIKLIEDYTLSNPFILLVRGTHHYNEIVSSRIIGMQQIRDKTQKA